MEQCKRRWLGRLGYGQRNEELTLVVFMENGGGKRTCKGVIWWQRCHSEKAKIGNSVTWKEINGERRGKDTKWHLTVCLAVLWSPFDMIYSSFLQLRELNTRC